MTKPLKNTRKQTKLYPYQAFAINRDTGAEFSVLIFAEFYNDAVKQSVFYELPEGFEFWTLEPVESERGAK